jgi:hypothetical protein
MSQEQRRGLMPNGSLNMHKIIFKAYDHDLHRFMRANEVRIDPSGQVWYNNSADAGLEIWEPLAETAEWLTIEAVIIIGDDYTNLKKRI